MSADPYAKFRTKVDVLDHGYARLISYTQPAIFAGYGDHGDLDCDRSWSGDLEVVRNARVSYNAEWRAGEEEGKDAKLIHYLMKNGHTSPFEAMTFTFEVKAPIFVLRQWHRHRTWSYNEVSARYTELPEEFYVPEQHDITSQSESNKQMRTLTEHPRSGYIRHTVRESCERGFEAYNELIAIGCPRELARGVLPVNTYSHMFATVNLHNLFKFLKLRLHEHAQYEIRVYAEALLELITPIVPVSVEAFRKHILEETK